MRGREFIMKDAYSFDIDNDAANIAYDKMFEAYTRILRDADLISDLLRLTQVRLAVLVPMNSKFSPKAEKMRSSVATTATTPQISSRLN